ncbi:MAG: DUF6036 family nucleotidyltransferase [Pyrinomonadaceae bacterium]
MRDIADQTKITAFMRAFGRLARSETEVFFTGGATAVLEGWRDSTSDIDLKFSPELDELFRGIPAIKEALQLNVELASPPDFIPEVAGWRDRCIYIGREGKVSYYSYDPYSQALSKIERGHEKDLLDVNAMFDRRLIEPAKLLSLFSQMEQNLYRYPAIDPKSFAAVVRQIVRSRTQ